MPGRATRMMQPVKVMHSAEMRWNDRSRMRSDEQAVTMTHTALKMLGATVYRFCGEGMKRRQWRASSSAASRRRTVLTTE